MALIDHLEDLRDLASLTASIDLNREPGSAGSGRLVAMTAGIVGAAMILCDRLLWDLDHADGWRGSDPAAVPYLREVDSILQSSRIEDVKIAMLCRLTQNELAAELDRLSSLATGARPEVLLSCASAVFAILAKGAAAIELAVCHREGLEPRLGYLSHNEETEQLRQRLVALHRTAMAGGGGEDRDQRLHRALRLIEDLQTSRYLSISDQWRFSDLPERLGAALDDEPGEDQQDGLWEEIAELTHAIANKRGIGVD